MSKQELESVAQRMVAKGKGILAADESMGTIKRRFDSIKIESNENNRRAYREMLFTAKGIEEAISGVILFDETLRTAASDGTPFPQILSKKGIMPGIKVDKGPVDIPGFPGEVVTEGLDGLRARVKEYKELGAKFAKWRAVITIGDAIPTRMCLEANAHALARYAALCQEGGLVPIVEPEVLLDGSHTVERCQEVTEETLKATFSQLFEQRCRRGQSATSSRRAFDDRLSPKSGRAGRAAKILLWQRHPRSGIQKVAPRARIDDRAVREGAGSLGQTIEFDYAQMNEPGVADFGMILTLRSWLV